jgi:Zn-dependent M28 family amino/carboxypeptidase
MRKTTAFPASALAFALLAVTAFGDATGLERAIRSITAESIRAHLAFLADDLLEGRAPGERGGEIAAHYIAAQFARAGAQSPRGGYLHSVPMHGWSADPEATTFGTTVRGRSLGLRYGDDIVAWPGTRQDATVAGELVFVGYGTRAAEHDWDDYKGRDLRGRIALVLVSDPPAPPTEPLLFDGRALTYYGRWTYKIEEARRQGAAGVLLVHDTERAGYGWDVVNASWGGEVLDLPPNATDEPPLGLEGWISTSAARRLLATAGIDLNELLVRAARRDFTPITTGITMQARLEGRSRLIESPNVIAVVPGRHPQRRAQVVAFTAHYDHLGIGLPVAGDSIYNGAYDNASGVAALLAIAEAFARLEPAPDRTIAFIATTGEEAGLLGATHYTRQPVFPLRQTVAVINIDGVNLWGETNDVLALGGGLSTLGDVATARARQMQLDVAYDRAPEKGFYFRSDHFPFARRGVPAMLIGHGIEFRNRPPGWGERTLARFESERYHRPADRFDAGSDLSGAVQQTVFTFLVGYDIAQMSGVPRWIDEAALRRTGIVAGN